VSKPPDFFDLVGDDGPHDELEQMRRAHDLLVAAGAPPELSPRLAEPPTSVGKKTSWLPRRRRRTAFVLAVGVAAAAFGVGFLVGNLGSAKFPSVGQPIAMHDVTPHGNARASILIGDRDSVGNWPLLVRVAGLKKLPKGQWYELYLSRKGKPAAYCGAFAVRGVGRTTVQLSVPYSFKGFDGWVVTTNKKQPARQVLLTT
jgi:hypothetical protein